jgi:hypothetical protein
MSDLRRAAGPLIIDQTETGTALRFQAGRLRGTLEGLESEAEARELGEAVLLVLARRRGRLPARVADRTPGRLREALEDSGEGV